MPVYTGQPRVAFDLLNAAIAQSVLLLSPQQSIDEIGSIFRPSVRYIPSFDLNLFRHHVFANLPSVLAIVRTLS
jgi:hypothetical protein